MDEKEKNITTQTTSNYKAEEKQVKKGRKGLFIGLAIVMLTLAVCVIWRVCASNLNEKNTPITEINQLIIGYYGYPGMGPGKYMKLSNNGNYRYKTEYLNECFLDVKADENIYSFETLNIESANKELYQNYKDNLKVEEVELNSNIEELVNFVRDLNLEKMSEKKYDNKYILDGLGWDFFIKIDDEEYTISGYEDMPEKLKKVIDYLEEITS